MRRTTIIIVIVAFLFGSAAYGSKRPRVSTDRATASHKKTSHLAKRTPQRGRARRASFRHLSRLHHSPSIESSKSATPSKASPSPETAALPDPSPAIESASLRKPRIAMPAPMRGSRESLVRQNEKSEEADGLERIEDDDDLADRIASGMLVPVPVSAALAVNGNLPENRRYCRPWTASFLADLSRAHEAQFHSPLLVTSAVRTVEYQKQLERVNGNAAAAEGDIASPHLTGASIDIAKQGLSRQQIAWMRTRLLPLEDAGKIDVEEEFQQSCFHITVYKSYVPLKPARKPPAQAAAAPVQPAQAQSAKASLKSRKSSRRKPAQAVPVQPKPEPSVPEQPSEPAAQPEAPIEG